MAQQTRLGITAIGRVMLPVSNQDRAIEFYVDKLGFEKKSDMPYGNGDRWVEVGPTGTSTAIALVLPMADGSGDKPGGFSRIALETKDIDADHAELRTRGVDVDEDVMRMGEPVPPMFWFRDQDGNSLLLVEVQ
jgi:catechol 2,3-dioxygenase-like lactoylglutathione lyase family enzyme